MILRARGGGNVALRDVSLAGLADARSGTSYAGMVPVTPRAAGGLPAWDAAIRIASQAVAVLDMVVWRGERPARMRVSSTWQARLFTGAPNRDQTWFEVWETVEASLTARRNAFLWRNVDAGRVVEMWALHPDQVRVVRDRSGVLTYRVAVGGGWCDPLGTHVPRVLVASPSDVLHIKGPGGGGLDVAPSPIDVFRATFGGGLAQQSYDESFWTRGVGDGIVLSFPQEITQTQAAAAKALWDEGSGLSGARGARVVSGGATVTSVQLSARDAQTVEAKAATTLDVARITGVPASLIEHTTGGGAGGSAPLSPEHELTRWVRYGLLPRLERIEDALTADPALFAGGRDTPEFDRDLVMADRMTEAQIQVQKVQAGIWLPDDVREQDGMPPLPAGVGQIPQITPVGGAPNAAPTSPPAPPGN